MRMTFGLVLVILRLFFMSASGFLTYMILAAEQPTRTPGVQFYFAFAVFSLLSALGLLMRNRAALLIAVIPFTIDAGLSCLVVGLNSVAGLGALIGDLLALVYLMRRSQKREYYY